MNVALSTARDQICDQGRGNLTVLILPIDLPLADGEALSGFIRCNGDVAIAADRAHFGTNVLLVRERAVSRFEFRFGHASFAQHQQVAAAAGFTVVVRVRRIIYTTDEIDKSFLLRDLLFWSGTGDRVAKSWARGCQPGRAAVTVAPHWRHPCAAAYQGHAAAIG